MEDFVSWWSCKRLRSSHVVCKRFLRCIPIRSGAKYIDFVKNVLWIESARKHRDCSYSTIVPRPQVYFLLDFKVCTAISTQGMQRDLCIGNALQRPPRRREPTYTRAPHMKNLNIPSKPHIDETAIDNLDPRQNTSAEDGTNKNNK